MQRWLGGLWQWRGVVFLQVPYTQIRLQQQAGLGEGAIEEREWGDDWSGGAWWQPGRRNGHSSIRETMVGGRDIEERE